MEIKKELNEEGNFLTIVLNGSLNTQTAPLLDASLSSDLDGIKELVIDLAKVDYVSSAGLRCFLKAQNHMDNVRGKLVIKHVAPAIKEVFDMTGFTDILTVE